MKVIDTKSQLLKVKLTIAKYKLITNDMKNLHYDSNRMVLENLLCCCFNKFHFPAPKRVIECCCVFRRQGILSMGSSEEQLKMHSNYVIKFKLLKLFKRSKFLLILTTKGKNEIIKNFVENKNNEALQNTLQGHMVTKSFAYLALCFTKCIANNQQRRGGFQCALATHSL
ncbi:hypothetical protein EGR_02543 [Echinococcus granulosus]|uniref:Uncharacterized protein n=1 Tax=Echinococcus granulosus TaxID=6210 RepID=W6UWB4_ECHGR|nr:hypothetical protein EGR_02543 [Echinococcus granulosus]EUB62747.1 hypothetical protein EGR_02543 [Echinococcus granulosus]